MPRSHQSASRRFAEPIHATTILGVRRDGVVAMAGDGQVTIGDVVMKHGARKIRPLADGTVIAGFAGAVADALTLFSKFEAQLRAGDGNLRRAAVELAKEWRTDRYLRRLEAQLIVGDGESILVLSGEGDVIEPDDGVAAIDRALRTQRLPRRLSWPTRTCQLARLPYVPWRSPLICASSRTTASRLKRLAAS